MQMKLSNASLGCSQRILNQSQRRGRIWIGLSTKIDWQRATIHKITLTTNFRVGLCFFVERSLRRADHEVSRMTEDNKIAHLDVNAPPWKHNPSAWSQRIPICILAGVAFLIASYMALYQWRLVESVWDPIFGEQTRHVLDSEVSEKMRRWFRIPDAAL